MRLTLRTLLAHLDDVLDPHDSEELKTKIKESNLASSLVDRIHSGMVRKQLSSPPVDGKGLGGDANSVAEYLDNTLPMDRLPEFERVCMESDMQLVEVAACHHILKEALGQQVSVTSELRSRLAGLSKLDAKELKGRTSTSLQRAGGNYVRLDDRHTAEVASREVTASNRVAVQPETIRGQGIDLEDDRIAERVPEYLRGRPSGRWRSALLTVGLIILLPIVAWQAIGSWSSLTALFDAPNDRPEKNPSQPESSDSSLFKNLPGVEGGATNNNGNNDSGPILGNREQADATDGVEIDSSLPVAEVAKEVKPSDVPADKSAVVQAINDPKLDPKLATAARWLPESRQARESVVFNALSKDGKRAIHRMGTGDSLSVGSTLSVPPSYQTEFQIDPGIRWVVTSATEMELHPVSNGHAHVRLHLARSLISPSTDSAAIEVQIGGDRSVLIQFAGMPATVGVELRYFWVPGSNPTEPSSIQTVFQLLGVEGNASCTFLENQVAVGAAVPLEVSKAIAWIESQPPQIYDMKEIPWWLKSCYQRPIEKIAAQELHSMLMSIDSNNLVPKLREVVGFRRPETAALAARTLAILGDYESLFSGSNALANPRLRAHWPFILDDVKQSAAASEQRIVALQNGLRANDEPKFAVRWRQILGYSSEQLAAGGGIELYELLASSNQIDRALASQSLRAILGNDRNYLPDNPSNEALQVLRKDLSDPKLNYRTPPSPLPELGVQ